MIIHILVYTSVFWILLGFVFTCLRGSEIALIDPKAFFGPIFLWPLWMVRVRKGFDKLADEYEEAQAEPDSPLATLVDLEVTDADLLQMLRDQNETSIQTDRIREYFELRIEQATLLNKAKPNLVSINPALWREINNFYFLGEVSWKDHPDHPGVVDLRIEMLFGIRVYLNDALPPTTVDFLTLPSDLMPDDSPEVATSRNASVAIGHNATCHGATTHGL